MRYYYLISRSWFRFLDLFKSRDCNFLPWVHFSSHLILDAGSMDDDSGSKKEGTNTESDTLGGSMRKGSMK